jgi:hypothetical protein
MKKLLMVTGSLLLLSSVFAQTDSTEDGSAPVKNKKISLSNRSNDHLLIQVGYAGWASTPDSINTSGLPRSFNMYFMLDFPFKTNPHFSVAIGPGIATDNVYFDKTSVGLKDNTETLQFNNLADTNHFKKYKLMTAWLEAPVELRYSADPANPKRGLKVAVGAKVGTLLAASTKGKTWQDKNDQTLISYTQKEKSKKFFNSTRLSVISRVGWGNFTLFGSYQFNPLFKEGLGPDVKPFSVGLTISGL